MQANTQAATPAPVVLDLVGLDGNAFALMGAFQCAARRQGWTRAQVAAVLDECRAGDYGHLLATLIANTTPEDAND